MDSVSWAAFLCLHHVRVRWDLDKDGQGRGSDDILLLTVLYRKSLPGQDSVLFAYQGTCFKLYGYAIFIC